MACHNSAERIDPALESLLDQDLDRAEFEVVVVDNGSDDDLAGKVRALREQHPDLQVRYLRLSVGNASLAYSMGIRAAAGLFVTLLDDDDRLAPGTLSTALEAARIDEVGLVPIWDVDRPGGAHRSNYIMDKIEAFAGQVVELRDVPVAMSYNAAKIVATQVAQEYSFDPTLGSGMDVVYWARLLCTARPRIRVLASPDGRCGYERTVRPGTVSRSLSVDWARDRVGVVAQLLQLVLEQPDCQELLEHLTQAQASHLATYLLAYPDEYDDVVRLIHASCPESFPYESITAGRATELAVLYAFPPANDASAIVSARRISEHRRIVDVLTCDVSSLRSQDPGSRALAGGYVDRVETIHTPPAFENWSAIDQFVQQGLDRVEDRLTAGKTYSGLYSRAMWPGAHFLAAALKVRHPDWRWRAEFSDPLSTDAQGRPRTSPLDPDSPVLADVAAGIAKLGLTPPSSTNVWAWAEHLPFALADEIIFTNPNQQQVMLDHIADPALRTHAASRSTVLQHPIPDAALYRARRPLPILDPHSLNLAYFGSFYANRGIGIVLESLARSPEAVRSQIRLHVFSTDPGLVSTTAHELGIASLVASHPYVDYLEFLALAALMDILIVNDVRTAGIHEINPYRPSKLSDYQGSGRDIWGIYEPGSPLSATSTTYSSLIDDIDGARDVLAQAVEARRAASEELIGAGPPDDGPTPDRMRDLQAGRRPGASFPMWPSSRRPGRRAVPASQ